MKTAILTTTPSAIAGFLSIIPPKDIRYYLGGMHVEPDKGIMVATDGHVLLCHRVDAEHRNENGASVRPFIIPAALLQNVAKAKCAQVRISIDTDTSAGRLITLETGNGETKQTPFESDGRTFTMLEVDGHFPDWHKIVPNAVSGAATQLDPDKLVQVKDAMALVCERKKQRYFPVYVNANGPEKAAMVTCSDLHTFAVVMPWRTDGSDMDLTLRRFELAPVAAPAVAVAA